MRSGPGGAVGDTDSGTGQSQRNLDVTMSAATTFVSLLSGSTLTYTIRLVNLSPNTAYNAVLSTLYQPAPRFRMSGRRFGGAS